MMFFAFTPCRAEEISTLDFLGPFPGVVYHYRDDSGVTVSVRGIVMDESGAIVIEEVTTFPDSFTLENGCIKKISEIYGLYASEKQLINKRFPLNGDTYNSILLDLNQEYWSNPTTLVQQDTKIVMNGPNATSKCGILERSQMEIFGKSRVLLKIGGQYCPVSTYASGIGLVEKNGMRLVRIVVNGETVTVF